MAWKYVFPPGSNNLNTDPDLKKSPFHNTRKVNMPRYFPPEISTFAESVKSDLIGAQHNKIYSNINKQEKQAMEECNDLQHNGTIVFQLVDKNAGVCVMNHSDYIKEGERQLKDKQN